MKPKFKYMRFVCLIIAASLLYISTVCAAEVKYDFKESWAEPYIEYVLENGYMTYMGQEVSDDAEYRYFMPYEGMTRAMLVESLAAVAGVEFDNISETETVIRTDDILYGKESASDEKIQWGLDEAVKEVYVPDIDAMTEMFDDMDGTESYAPAVAWAVEKGIVNGTGSSFCPDVVLDRQTLAVMMQRFVMALDIELDGDWSVMLDYNDIEDVSEWAVDGIAFCTVNSLMNGTADGNFLPKRTLTRAEGAAVVYRLANHIKN
jgi:hypothetical protein